MPTFPHHRNIKKPSGSTASVGIGAAANAPAAIAGNADMPGMSDLLGTLVKKRRFD